MSFTYKTKIISKRITATLLLLILIISCSGCNQIPGLENDNIKPSKYEKITYPSYYDSDDSSLQTDIVSNHTRYESEFFELATETHMVPYLITTIDNCLYYVTLEGDDPNNGESYTIWCENFESGHVTEQVMQLPADYEITNITVDEEHNIYLFTKTKVDIRNGEISRYYLTKYKNSGAVVLHREITEDIVRDEQPEQEVYYYHKIKYNSFFGSASEYSIYDITSAQVDKNGNLYANNARGITILNSRGKQSRWIDSPIGSPEFYYAGIIHDKKDNICVAHAFIQTGCAPKEVDYVRNFNLLGQLSNKAYRCSSYIYNSLSLNSEIIFSAGLNYDILTKSDYSLYGCNFKSKTATQILIWANVGIDGRYVDYFAELDNGKFIAISSCFDDGPVEAAVISSVTEQENEDKIITLGIYRMNEYIQNIVFAYNKSQNDYEIEILEINRGADRSQCDIFAIDGNSEMAEQYVAEGKIEDLTPYFDASTKISIGDFIPQIVESHTYDGLLIGIPSSVEMKLVSKDSAGGTANWTIEEMQTQIRNNPGWKSVLDAGTVAYTLAYYNGHEYVNLEDRNCYFEYSNGESSFYDITDYADTFPTESNDYSLPTGFMRLPSSKSYVDNAIDLYSYNPDEYTGILSDDHMTFCISASSQNKSEAWTFIEFLLDDYITELNLYDVIPTRMDILEKINNDNFIMDIYETEQYEKFLRIISEATVMKYNISTFIMKYIENNLEASLIKDNSTHWGNHQIGSYILSRFSDYYDVLY